MNINNKKHEYGPFDIIGDVHGCYDELCELLDMLGYQIDTENFTAQPPKGRRTLFLGDLCDRGPSSVEVLRLVMHMTQSDVAYCLAGNHDIKLLNFLRGSQARASHALHKTVEQLKMQGEVFIRQIEAFLGGLICHYVFDDGRLVIAHAGLIEKYQGQCNDRVRNFCLYGDITGETDEFGLPIRLPWANEYRGKSLVVYGHTPIGKAKFVNNTICLDTGCVFGGKLTVLRYPEIQLLSVAAKQEYYTPVKPFLD